MSTVVSRIVGTVVQCVSLCCVVWQCVCVCVVAGAAIIDGASTLLQSAVQPLPEANLMEDDPAIPGNMVSEVC